jgi:hypothetical protein
VSKRTSRTSRSFVFDVVIVICLGSMERILFVPLRGASFIDGLWVGLMCKFCDSFSCLFVCLFVRYIIVGQVGQKEHFRTIQFCHVSSSLSPPPPSPTSPFREASTPLQTMNFGSTNEEHTGLYLLALDASNTHLALARSPETNTTRTAE